MKQIIKVKVLTEGCLPVISEDGDCIDLRAAEDVHLECPYAVARTRKGGESTRKVIFTTKNIPLGVAMELPKGMEALVVPRSSSNKKFNILQVNTPGVIDHSYCGNDDQWHMPVMTTGDVDIKKGDRICQFRVVLSQKATMWQKLKWLFSSGIKFKIVDNLTNNNRGGLGHSGRN
jgi:dUTP pyrophosphatase